jgi:DNA-binding transcriptional LysR family regulator
MPDFLDLKIFARVVEVGSLSAAGRELNFSPTVVSKRITRLEEELGTRLIQRSTRQLTLTEVGEGFYSRTLLVLEALEEAERFASGKGAPRGLLRVSAPTAFGRLHIAPYLKSFLQAFPDLRLELDLSDDFIDIIARGFDVAVRIGSLDDSSMVTKRLAPNRRIFCAAPDYLAQFGAPRDLADLENHKLLAATPRIEWQIEGPTGPALYRPHSVLQTNSSEVVREAVVSGLGIGLRSTWDVSKELKSGSLLRVLPDYAGSSDVGIHIIYPSRKLVPSKVRAFIDHLTHLYAPEPYWDQGIPD